MSENPFGPAEPAGDTPLGAATNAVANPSLADAATKSIVDTVLDLDGFLSGDVRLAEKTVHIYIEPDREARIDALHAELATLVDNQGRPVAGPDDALGAESGRSALVVASELQAEQDAYAASRRAIRLQQLPSDDWQAFRTRHRKTLDEGAPYPDALWDELIVACAVAPKFTPEKLAAFHKRVGSSQMDLLRNGAWEVNRETGVSVPKSPLSSLVLRRAEHARS